MCAVVPADAANWRVLPSVSLAETWTDNVALAPSDFARSDVVTQLTPSVTFSGTGANANVNGTVSVPILLYARSGSENNNVNLLANIRGTAKAVDGLFYIDGAISVTQPFLTPFAAQPGDLTSVTQNRYTASTYSISPYLKSSVPGSTAYELRHISTWAKLSDASIATSDSYTSQWIGRIETPIAPLGWRAEFDLVEVKFDSQGPQRTNLVRVGPRYAYDPQLRLFANVGYEDNRYPLADYHDVIYGVGLEWRPTQRTKVVANWEHRFFGASYLVSFDHRTPLSVWAISASRNITSFPQQLGTLAAGVNVQGLLDQLFLSRIPDPAQRQNAINTFIQNQGLSPVLSSPVNLYTQQISVAENATATLGLLGARNSIFLTLFYLKNEPIAGSGSVLPSVVPFGDNNTQAGANVVWTHSLTPYVALNFTANASRTEANGASSGNTNQGFARFAITSTLSANTSVYAGVRYQESRSDLQSDYKESAAFAGVSYTYR